MLAGRQRLSHMRDFSSFGNFRLCNAPATFKRIMDWFLSGMHWSHCLISLSVSMDVDSLAEPVLTGRSSPPAATIPVIGSTLVVLSSHRSSPRALSLVSQQLDGSFYIANDSLAGPTPALHPKPELAPSLCLEGPFAAATSHPLGDNKGGCSYRFTTYWDYDFTVRTGIYLLIKPGPKQMDQIHVLVANHRHCAPTTT